MSFAKLVSTFPAFTSCLRIALGLLFLLAASSKLIDPDFFFASILRFDFFDANLLWLVSRILPPTELLLAFWLLSGWHPLPAYLLALWLLLLFSSILTLAWLRDIEVDCACFGSLLPFSSFLWQICRNLFLASAFLWLIYRQLRLGKK